MTTSSTFDQALEESAAGRPLAPAVVRDLIAAPDILPLGMLADAQRRARHGTRTTYVRVATVPADTAPSEAVPPAAREVRLAGAPASLAAALAAVRAARAAAGDRIVSGFTWTDVEGWAGGLADGVADTLRALRGEGLDGFASLPLDRMTEPVAALEQLAAAGFATLRLTIDSAAAADRVALLFLAESLQARVGCIQAIGPLPLSLASFRPTTGYEDVKMVAAARLAAPAIPSVQVDWLRYGPKLAQVALTFGADDIDNVSALDEAPEGRRRAPLEEIRRNIEAAGFTPVERDGRFAVAG